MVGWLRPGSAGYWLKISEATSSAGSVISSRQVRQVTENASSVMNAGGWSGWISSSPTAGPPHSLWVTCILLIRVLSPQSGNKKSGRQVLVRRPRAPLIKQLVGFRFLCRCIGPCRASVVFRPGEIDVSTVAHGMGRRQPLCELIGIPRLSQRVRTLFKRLVKTFNREGRGENRLSDLLVHTGPVMSSERSRTP